MNAIEPVMPWCLGPDYPRWVDRLRDGTCVAVRPVRVDDGGRERTFIESLSPESRRLRFLGQVRSPSRETIERFTDIDYEHHVAFAAVLADDPDEAFLGVSRYAVARDGASCECAVTVLDQWQHKGLGSLLMRHLIDVARARGMVFMYSIDASDNRDMADLARHLGFERVIDPDDARQVIHRLYLPR
jgi:GNAT superfamily N-acetyltransferase